MTATTHIQTLTEFPKNQIIKKNFGQISDNIVKIRKESNNIIFITTKIVKELENGEKKLKGIKPNWVDRLNSKFKKEIIIVEGDGAAMKSIKAPAAYEPVVPDSTNKLITIMGLKDFGKKVNNKTCHRVEKINELTSSSFINKEMIIKILTDKNSYGYYKERIDDFIIILNQVRSSEYEIALEIGEKLIKTGVQKVILADTKNNNPIIKTLN